MPEMVRTVRLLGVSRFNLKYSAGTLPHAALMTGIGLIGTEVAPRVREAMEKGTVRQPAKKPG